MYCTDAKNLFLSLSSYCLWVLWRVTFFLELYLSPKAVSKHNLKYHHNSSLSTCTVLTVKKKTCTVLALTSTLSRDLKLHGAYPEFLINLMVFGFCSLPYWESPLFAFTMVPLSFSAPFLHFAGQQCCNLETPDFVFMKSLDFWVGWTWKIILRASGT